MIAEINEIEMKKTIAKINKTKSWFFEKINKIDESLFSQTIRKETEKAMAPPSSTLAWEIPWTEEPGRLQSMGSLRIVHD